jgi:tRNA pseudouridine38-40 synthase
MTLFDAPAGQAGVVAPGPAPAKVKMVVAYDGSDFNGFAVQRNQPSIRTVAEVLGETIPKVLRHDVDLTCAGRTDAGVHAWGQVVSFPAEPDLDTRRLQSGINSMLGPELVVRSCEIVAPGFDARHGATWRRYRYTVLSRPVTDPFRDRFVWHIADPLDLRALRLAADPFVGPHDFSAFCRKGPDGSSRTRRVYESRWVDEGDGVLRYEIRANAFCWQMVRAIVGTMVDAGQGRLRPGELMAIIRSGDRNTAGQLAPARGLCLWDVGYD